MVAHFCVKCGSILIPEMIDEVDFALRCYHCNSSKEVHGKISLIEKEKVLPKKAVGRKISEAKNEFATYKNKCKKCGYGKAQVIDMGIFYSDEDNLILLKCGKCGWAERLGRKTS